MTNYALIFSRLLCSDDDQKYERSIKINLSEPVIDSVSANEAWYEVEKINKNE